MRKILIAEATLSDAQGMSFREKLETARLLDAINTNIIELCPLSGEKSDEILVKTIAAQTNYAILSCPVTDGEVEKTWECVKGAKNPRLNVKLPVSVVGMEYGAHLKAPKLLERISREVAIAREMCGDVEFTALDATRAEEDFLVSAIEAAVKAGADTVTLSDDAGTFLPDEFGAFVKRLIDRCELLKGRTLGICASDAMSMAEACAFEAVKAGANLVYARAAGKTMPDYRIFVDILGAKGEGAGVYSDADVTAIRRTVDRIKHFSAHPESESASAREAGLTDAQTVIIDAASDIQAVGRAAESLGYELSDEDLAKVYDRFKSISDKKTVDMRELDAIIAANALQVPPTYNLYSYVINSGNIITASAHIVLDKNDGERVQGISVGDGPIDAAFMAIEQLIGHHYELDEFSVRAVTGGYEAVGEALVRLRDGGKLYSGRGISTDIVGAAIRAYVNALNKIVYRENQ